MVQCSYSLERYASIRIFEQIGNFSELWATEGKCCPDFFVILASFFCLLWLNLCSICRLSFSSRCCGKLLFLVIDCIISHSVCFFSGLRGKECIPVTWNLKAAIFCSIGRLEKKLIVVSVVVGFLYMSTSSFVCLRVVVRSRKAMELCSSYVGFSFMLLCILYIYVLMVCKLIFVVSYMTNKPSTYHT